MNANYHTLSHYRNDSEEQVYPENTRNILGEIASTHQLLPRQNDHPPQTQFSENINMESSRYQPQIPNNINNNNQQKVYNAKHKHYQPVQNKDENNTDSLVIDLSPVKEEKKINNDMDKKKKKPKSESKKDKKKKINNKSKKSNSKKLIANYIIIPIILIIVFIILVHPKTGFLNKYISDIGSSKGIIIRALILALVYIIITLLMSFV